MALVGSRLIGLGGEFLHRVFITPNVRVMAQADLVEALDDTLYGLREQAMARRADKAFPKPALEYLNDWAANDKGWLRKFYPTGQSATAHRHPAVKNLHHRTLCVRRRLRAERRRP